MKHTQINGILKLDHQLGLDVNAHKIVYTQPRGNTTA